VLGPVASAEQRLTIVLTGQSMIRSDVRTTAPAVIPRTRPLLAGDVVFTNLEGAVAEHGQVVRQGRGFLIPPASLDALQAFGFNLLALSDNHAFDLGVAGIANTLREVGRRGIAHAGIGNNLAEAAAPAYLHVANMTIALVASASGLISNGSSATVSRPGVNELRVHAADQLNEASTDLPDTGANTPDAEDAARILEGIRAARQHADIVIVYQHNHVFGNQAFSSLFSEGMPERLAPNPWLVKWTHEEIAAGADIVVMHGAPLLHGIEIFRGRPIFYDLGNFIYNLPATLTYIDEPMSWESVVARLQFRGRELQSISLLPVALNVIGAGQPDVHDPYADNEFLHTRGLPAPATGAQAAYILRRLARLSEPFGTRIQVSGDSGSVVLRALRTDAGRRTPR
jgi:poly-gamma-glutamate capsule biosynthesis protein CapA/YwtB (metallophosphatase superfamily)